jgi:hydrogenase expression/formation protein HypE
VPDKILMGHGSGGRMMHELISSKFAPAFGMEDMGDAAVLELKAKGRLAMSTDSYVVSPLFFPGGNIGELAVNGTVNDIAMVGAEPVYLTCGFIIEEGMPLSDLERIVASMAKAADAAGVKIVAGDTKVVDKGKGDGLFINTAGVGLIPEGIHLSPSLIREGDVIIISGEMGRHGMAVMAERSGLSFDPPLTSDTAALGGLVNVMLKAAGTGLRAMRDPTRGGVATTLKEFALESGLAMELEEEALPVPPGVRGACDLLGLDPLFVANEGLLLAVVSGDMAEYLLKEMKAHPLGAGARAIGSVLGGPEGKVLLRTSIGGTRIVDMLEGGQLPRIC